MAFWSPPPQMTNSNDLMLNDVACIFTIIMDTVLESLLYCLFSIKKSRKEIILHMGLAS